MSRCDFFPSKRSFVDLHVEVPVLRYDLFRRFESQFHYDNDLDKARDLYPIFNVFGRRILQNIAFDVYKKSSTFRSRHGGFFLKLFLIGINKQKHKVLITMKYFSHSVAF